MFIGKIEIPAGAGLAPMAGVTDVNMRVMCFEQGCAWAVSEMLSAKGYIYNPEARVHQALLELSPREGITALQFFGSEEYYLSEAVKRLNESGFSFFDFNMGCPAHKIVGNGEGSALMKELPKAAKLIETMVKVSQKPVTVKFRSGWDVNHINAVEAAKMCEDSGASAVTVHPRTREMQYSGNADWDIIAQVKVNVKIPVIGNGDIRCGADAIRMLNETGCDAVCAARAAQGNPWLFAEIKCALDGNTFVPPSYEERVDTALRHLDMQVASLGARQGVLEMRKHIAWYLQGLPASGKLRASVNTFTTPEQVKNALFEYKKSFSAEE